MYSKISTALFFLLFSFSFSYAQKGKVKGVVVSELSNEALFHVSVSVADTSAEFFSDLGGAFSLSLPEGIYQLKFVVANYDSIMLSNVKVLAGEVTVLDTIKMHQKATIYKGVGVSKKRMVNNENSILMAKKDATMVSDGMSNEAFKKTGASDAPSAMKNITGVSISGGKYVYVRGLGDRYTKTILNGLDIPGLDPDRNSLQMDIFPTNVIDNIMVYKSLSAELPADFTGGIVNISIKDFPESKRANVSVSGGYNSLFHFNNNYLTYEGGKTDAFGFDDGTRAIPAISNIPFFNEALSNEAKKARYQEILSNFNPTMAAYREKSLMDYSVGGDYGTYKKYEKLSVGFNIALSYKSNTEYYQNAQFSTYGLSSDVAKTELENRELQVGDYGVKSVLMSGLVGMAIKTAKSKYRLNLLHLQNGESKAGIFDFSSNDQGGVFQAYQHNLDYSQKSLSNILLDGNHSLRSNWNIEWKLSPTYSTMVDPDVRFTRYTNPTPSTYFIGTEAGFPTRIWRNLEEINLASVFHATKTMEVKGKKVKLKTGAAYTYKQRDFIIRNFDINVRNVPLTGDPNELFKDENLWPYNNDMSKGTTYDVPFMPNNPNKFNANSNYAAAYVSTEFTMLKKMKTVIGVRAENFVQRYTGQDQLGKNVLKNDEVLNELDIFPTVNLVYELSKKQNLRSSFAKTIARPSFKELSFAEIFDPITGRTFIGGLFRDANDVAGEVYWDGKLVSTDIYNADLRWEIFLGDGQTISLSAFYKKFIRPIETVQYATQAGSFQPRNVGDGQVLGGEIEFRKNLNFIHAALKNWSINCNFTVTESRIKLSKTEYDSRVANAREGQLIGEYRDMAGQAPYLLNGGIAYNGSEKAGFWKGVEMGLYYNVQGPTLYYVGIVDRPDIYTEPFHSLNFNANKSFGKDKRWQVGVKMENLLNDKLEYVYKAYNANDQYFSQLTPGITFQARLAYKIF